MEENKVFFKPFVWIAILLDVIAVIISLVMQNPEVEYTYKYVNGEITSHSWLDNLAIGCYIYTGIVILLLVVAIIQILRYRKQLNVVVNLSVAIILIPVTIALMWFAKSNVTGVEWDCQPEYYEYSEEEYRIVICEKTIDRDSFFEIYQLEEDGTAYFMEEFSTYGGYRNNGNYIIEWYPEGIEIQYNVDGEGFQMRYDVKWVK